MFFFVKPLGRSEPFHHTGSGSDGGHKQWLDDPYLVHSVGRGMAAVVSKHSKLGKLPEPIAASWNTYRILDSQIDYEQNLEPRIRSYYLNLFKLLICGKIFVAWLRK